MGYSHYTYNMTLSHSFPLLATCMYMHVHVTLNACVLSSENVIVQQQSLC